MSIYTTIDWTTVDAYVRGSRPVPRGERLLAALIELLLRVQAERVRREDESQVRRLEAASGTLPAYLRRDLGLPSR